ncbi:Uncharacterised protein [Mycobacterium tuberculosis]|uniref:Uncharacterized protein n=1 Tax=Mycobacterium tuberculosis TaxID=1773 RepID=A0A916PHF3_MYCTX|nr:Uncharacterised protein [Mycobacterium tuberculosis]
MGPSIKMFDLVNSTGSHRESRPFSPAWIRL